MKPEQQRIELAKLNGWEEMWIDDRGNTRGFNLLYAADGKHRLVPDYLNDLNAVHEAEAVCIIGDEELEEKYWLMLYEVTSQTRWPFDATAAQRCEAILRVKGIWK